MRTSSVRGKLTQLSHLPVTRWSAFAYGWLRRQTTGNVPCALPRANRLLQIPLREFYDSYWFFAESMAGIAELTFFLDRLSSNDVFYDIGSFRGAYAAAAKAARGESVEVHLFEPIPENLRAIETISRLNQFEKFRIVPSAVGSGSAVKGVFNETDRMLRDGDASNATSQMEIPATTLDAYSEKSGRPPSIIKIDVDGFELQVLQGGINCLTEFRPRLWIELHPAYLAAQGQKWEEATKILKSIGYQEITFYEDYAADTRDASFHIWCEA